MSQTLARAKRRSGRRLREGGAVIFIVSITLALLATIGGFAMMSASNEARTSGYERRALQSQYLAEYAMLGVAANLNGDFATFTKGWAMDPTRRSTSCTNLRAVAGTTPDDRACVRLGQWSASGVDDGFTKLWTGKALHPRTVALPGALGFSDPNADDGTGRPFGADFSAELTEFVEVRVPSGYSINGQGIAWCSLRVTVDAFGMTRPDLAVASTTDTQRFGATGLAVSHGQIVSPARPCPP